MRFLQPILLSLFIFQLQAQSDYYKTFLTDNVIGVEVKRHVIDPTYLEPEYDKYSSTRNTLTNKQKQFLSDTIILTEYYEKSHLTKRLSIKQAIGGLESQNETYTYANNRLATQISVSRGTPLSQNDIRLYRFGYYSSLPSADTIYFYYENGNLWRKELRNMRLRDMYGSRLKELTSYLYNTSNQLQTEQSVIVPIYFDSQLPQSVIDKLLNTRRIELSKRVRYYYNDNNLLLTKEEYDPPFNYRTSYVYNDKNQMTLEIKGNFGEIGDYEMDSIFYQTDINNYRWKRSLHLVYNINNQLVSVQQKYEDLEYKNHFMINNAFKKMPYKPRFITKTLYSFSYNKKGQLFTEEIPGKVKYTFIYTELQPKNKKTTSQH